jgi:hypothetical protein
MKIQDGKLYQLLTPTAFLRLLKTNREAIRTSHFIAPKIGSRGFGKIFVEYNYVPTKSKTTTAKKRVRARSY